MTFFRTIKTMEIPREGLEKIAETEFTMEDLLLSELLHWFKHDFFKWVDSPKCGFCCSESTFSGVKSSTDKRVSRIEVYKYVACIKTKNKKMNKIYLKSDLEAEI